MLQISEKDLIDCSDKLKKIDVQGNEGDDVMVSIEGRVIIKIDVVAKVEDEHGWDYIMRVKVTNGVIWLVLTDRNSGVYMGKMVENEREFNKLLMEMVNNDN